MATPEAKAPAAAGIGQAGRGGAQEGHRSWRRQGPHLADPGAQRVPVRHRGHPAAARVGAPRRCAARGAGQPDAYAEPVEGAVVLPRPAGDARLLRPVARGRGAADVHHHRADGDPLHRHQPEGERLLLLGGPEVGAADVLPGLPHPVGVAHHHRHAAARPRLELVLVLGEVGPAQGRVAHQRRPAVPPGRARRDHGLHRGRSAS